jgi:putative peptidoglycan lipid II flippase
VLGWLVAWALDRVLGDGLLPALGALAAGGLALLAAYVMIARALHVRELTELLGRVRGRVA